VEINIDREAPKNKHQKTINKTQINSNLQTTKTKQAAKTEKLETCNQEPETFNLQHVTIKQTGKNNSIKINSR
jgi:hypothetical protein